MAKVTGERSDERAERLKAALRDNLKRRKDQSRARAGIPPTGQDTVGQDTVGQDTTGQDTSDGEPPTSFEQKVPYRSAD